MPPNETRAFREWHYQAGRAADRTIHCYVTDSPPSTGALAFTADMLPLTLLPCKPIKTYFWYAEVVVCNATLASYAVCHEMCH